jgi:hypothetical protein
MAFKVNYSQQRGDRERAKQKKQQEKLRKREEDAARRRAARAEGNEPSTEPPAGSPETSDGAE